MADSPIKSRVEALLSEANREKDRETNRALLVCLFIIFVLPFVAFFTANLGLGFGILLSLIIALVIPALTFLALAILASSDDERRARRLADHIRDVFPEADGEFEKAMALLRSAKTKSEVEKDLIKALGEVSFEPEPALLGDLEQELAAPAEVRRRAPANDEEPTSKGAAPSCDYVPLDPYRASHGSGTPAGEAASCAGRPAQSDEMPPDCVPADYQALPLADPGREQMAEQAFSEYQEMSPEEWAARWADGVLCSSFGDFKYRNTSLGIWLYRLHQILVNPDEVERCREQYLTAEEISEIERRMNEPF